ncbi:MAG: erythromycin esterase family protein [Microbacterium sp.]|nr:erythromycin esterase family protein [Microbacterium sp.]
MSAQIAPFVQPIPAIDPARPELPTSVAVGALIGDARVVAFGEAAHNVVEFTAYGDALLRTLVRDHGVTAFVMESGFAEGLLVDEWIHGGPGTLEDIARDGITYRFGESDGIRHQLAWMRAWNEAGGDVRFYGMDLPGSSTSPGAAVRACLARIPARDGDDELRRRTELGGRTEAAVAYAEMTDAERAAFAAELRLLIERVEADGDDVARLCAESVRAFLDELVWDGADGPYPRERFMARAVEWIAAREQRILVYAHDTHVRRTALDGREWMGALLSARLGDELRVIGTTYGTGPVVVFTERSPRPYDCDVELRERGTEPGSVEEVLDRAAEGADGVLLDLRAVDPAAFSGVDGMLAGGRLEAVADFPATFDALIHLTRVHATPGAFERLREEFDAPRGGAS